MFGPQAKNLFRVVAYLQKREGVHLRLPDEALAQCVPSATCALSLLFNSILMAP